MSKALFIDLGNSRIKWMYAGQAAQESIAHGGQPLREILDRTWKHLPVPERIWLASVASSPVRDALMEWTRQNWHMEPYPLAVQPMACGVTCGYREPGQLGVDRWMAIIAGYHHSPGGVCVVDCGTATTLDAVDGQGRHLGGFILPGLEMMRDALWRGTNLDVETGESELAEWGNSTASCIDLGIRKSVVSLVESSVERMQAAGVCDPGVILSGGASAQVRPYLKLAHEHREALVLEGMMRFVRELKS